MRIGHISFKVRRQNGDWIVNQKVGYEKAVEFEITYPSLLGVILSLRWLPVLYKVSKIDPDEFRRSLEWAMYRNDMPITKKEDTDEDQVPPA